MKPENPSTFAKFVRSISNPFGRPDASDTAPVLPPHDPATPEPGKPIIAQELGVSQESYWTRFELYQYNPDDLLTKKGIKILEKMATSDDTIAMGLAALKMMRLSSGYEIVQASDDPIDVQIADEVADNFDFMKGSLREKLYSMMGTLDMGWSLHEKIWDFWEVGPHKGHVRLSGLKSKNPQYFNPSVDDFNNLTGIVMISPPAYARKLPHQKFLLYSANKRYENVFGTSRIRTLYDWWYLKGLAKAGLAVLIGKYGKDTPIGFVPATMKDEDKKQFLAALVNLAKEAAIAVPDGTRVEFAQLRFDTINGLLATIEKADQQMTKILLGQVMSSGTSGGQTFKSGSQAGGGAGGGNGGGGGSLQSRTLDMYLNFIGQDVAENPMAELIKDIVDANYTGVIKYPILRFKPMSEADLTATIAAWSQAAAAGVVTPGPDDEAHIREVLGFPGTSSKTDLRPNRFKSTAKLRPQLEVREPVDPAKLPTAGYRPSTPSAPGMPANYSERSCGCQHRDFAEGFKPFRALTKYEKHTDFAETLSILEQDGAQEIAKEAADVLHKAVNKLKVDAKKALGDSKGIRNLTLPYRGELAAVLRDGMQAVAKKAMRQAKAELKDRASKFAEQHDFNSMDPKEVLQLINDKSFTMAGDISDEVLKKVKQTMYDGVKKGSSYKDMVYDIENAIAPYLDLADAVGDVSGARLMTAVRTSVAEAYSDARDSIFLDPELDGFVVAFQFSSVLDGETTETCMKMDGRIYKASNPVWDAWTPPLLYNCRSVKIPITQADGWDGIESDLPDEAPPEW